MIMEAGAGLGLLALGMLYWITGKETERLENFKQTGQFGAPDILQQHTESIIHHTREHEINGGRWSDSHRDAEATGIPTYHARQPMNRACIS